MNLIHLALALVALLHHSLVSASQLPFHGDVLSDIRGDVNEKGSNLPTTEAYWNVDASTYQSNFNRLSAQGYRPISLSVHGQPPAANVRYSALWIQRSGPAFQAVHGLNLADFAAWSQRYTAQGYVSTLVSATGPADSAVFTGLMDKVPVSNWTQLCDIDSDHFTARQGTAWTDGVYLKSFREYGTPSARRFCAIWHANTQHDRSSWWTGLTHDQYQVQFTAEMTKPYWHPNYVTESEDFKVTATFGDRFISPSFSARHGLSASDLSAEFQNQKAQGRYLIHLSGAGSGTNTRFIGIWAENDQPEPRTWRATGTATGFRDNAAALSSVDSAVQSFMQAQGVRQAQVSIGKSGNILLERAYSWSEPDRTTTQPEHRFLLASVSKMFCEAAIQNLYDSKTLSPGDKVFPKLGYTSTPADTRINDITVQELVDHTGGFDQDFTSDAVFLMRDIARARGGTSPADMKDVTDFIYTRKLDYDPGTLACTDPDTGAKTYCYSNQGYIILAALVEIVSGKTYMDFIKGSILDGLDVQLWTTAGQDHASDPVSQENILTGPSALQPQSDAPVASIFGGDGMVKEAAVGPSSLASSASTLVKFLAKHAAWGNGPRSPGSSRNGRMSGVRTYVESRGDGLDWAFTVNTDEFTDNWADTMFWNVASQINAWLNTGPVS